jgi:fibronectin-binding autotransporter adhesin
MAAPVLQSVSSLSGLDRTTAQVPVPSGVANGHLIVLTLYKESTAAITPPSGFVLKTTVTCSGAQLHNHYLYYKHAVGADSGTYDFSWTGTAWVEAKASRWTGALTSGDPFGSPVNTATSDSSGSSAATPAVSTLTPSSDQCTVVFSGTHFDSGANWTAPSGFTEQGTDGMALCLATLAQTTATATGSVSATATNSALGRTGLVGYLLPASLDYTGTAAVSGSGSLTATGVPRPTGTATLAGSGSLAASGAPRPTGVATQAGSGSLAATGLLPGVLAADSFTGTDGAPWSSTWAEGLTDAGASFLIQSNAGRVTTASAGGYAGASNRKLNIANPEGGVWLMKFRWPTGDECYPGVWMRGPSDRIDAEAGYFFALNRPAGAWFVGIATAYASTDLDTGAFSFASNTWYWVRCGVVDDDLKLKIWADGVDEPAAWLSELTDTTYAGAGRVGLRVGPGNVGSATFDIDSCEFHDAFTIQFAAEAARTGSGSLTAAGAPRPTAAPSFTGTGSLSAVGVAAFAVTASMAGAGALTLPTRTTAVPGSVGFAGAGALTTSGTPAVAGGAAGLAGSGSLTLSPSISVAGPAARTGSGTLAAVGMQVAVDTAARTAAGTLTATGVPTPTAVMGATAEGALTVGLAPAIPGAASQTATGTLTTAVIPAPTGAVARTGSGTLTGSGVPTPTAAAASAGAGALSTTRTPAISGASATLTGSGILTLVGITGFAGGAGLSSTGVLAAVGHPKHVGTATLASAGALAAPSSPRIPGTATRAGAGTLAVAGVPAPARIVALAGAGGLSVVGVPALVATAALAGGGALVVRPSGTNFTRGIAELAPPARRLALGGPDE